MRQRITLLLILLSAFAWTQAKADTWAVKTNLLYDVAAAPNVGVEYGWKDHWSINADVTMPWWADDAKNEWCYEVLNIGLEGRYWFEELMHGHFVGVYGQGGCYDLGHERRGKQDRGYWAAGFSYGYSFRLGKHLALECSLGLGCLYTDYTEYKTKSDNSGIYYAGRGKYTWSGPTKAGISLIWAF